MVSLAGGPQKTTMLKTKGLFSRFVIGLVKVYQNTISVRRPFRVCRFEPTCSQYMITAVSRFGLPGLLMGICRLLRCQPFAKGGYDPVPNHFTLRRNHRFEGK